jgi:hypothetical protein
MSLGNRLSVFTSRVSAEKGKELSPRVSPHNINHAELSSRISDISKTVVFKMNQKCSN